MNKEAFRTIVDCVKPPSISQTSLDVAIDFYFEWNLLDHRAPRACVRECLNLAMRIDMLRTADKASQSGESPFQRMPLMPEDLVMSDDFAEKIKPAVEQLRTTLFESPAPPFPAYEDAVQWLEHTAAEQEASAQANNQTRIALERSIHEKLAEYRVLTGEDYQPPFLRNLLEYAKPGSEWVHRVHAWGGTSLATLANETRKLVDATGFTQASMVAYVLAGIRPLLMPISIDLSWGHSNEFNISRRSATVEFRTSKVTEAHLRAIRKNIRSGGGTERKKPLTGVDKQLLDMVQRLGGVPNDKGHGEHKAFFERVRQEFNAWVVEHGGRQHKDWKVTRNKYDRLRKKMRQGDPDAQEHYAKPELNI